MKGKNAAYPKVIDQMKASEELSKSVELRQNKYLNNLIEQDHRFPCAIDQTREGISFVQYGSPSLKRIRGDEHANALDKLWESKKEMFWLVQNSCLKFSELLRERELIDRKSLPLKSFCNTTGARIR